MPNTTYRGAVAGPADYSGWANMLNSLQQQFNVGRIPNAAALESASSADIAGLLSPPSFFADTDRMAAEAGAARGIPTSAAAYSGGLRMTDEERLKRIALGENLLSGAYARNPTAPLPPVGDFVMSPGQAASVDLANRQFSQNAADRAAALDAARNRSNPMSLPGGMPFGLTAPTGPTNYFGTLPEGTAYQGVFGGESYTGSNPAGQPESFDSLWNSLFGENSIFNVEGDGGGVTSDPIGSVAGGGPLDYLLSDTSGFDYLNPTPQDSAPAMDFAY